MCYIIIHYYNISKKNWNEASKASEDSKTLKIRYFSEVRLSLSLSFSLKCMKMENLGLSFISKSLSLVYFATFIRVLCFFPSESGISVPNRSKRFKERGNPILVITAVLGFHEACWIETKENDGRIEYRRPHQKKRGIRKKKRRRRRRKKKRESERRRHVASLSFGFFFS